MTTRYSEKLLKIFHVNTLNWHTISASPPHAGTKRRYWSGRILKKGGALKGNAEAGGIQHHNLIIKDSGKCYPDQNREEEQCSPKGDPEYLDNGAEQDCPEQNDRQKAIECRVPREKEERPSDIQYKLENKQGQSNFYFGVL